MLPVVLAALGLLLAPVGPSGGVARAASTDLTIVTEARYAVQPDQGRIRVVVDATIANHRAETRTSRFYYDHAFLAVQPGATSPALAKGPKGAAVHIASRTADQTVLRIDFGARLYGGHTTQLRIAFNLVDTGGAARRLIRVGPSLVTFPVWAYASDGASGSRVAVRIPAGYDVTVESGSIPTRARTSDGGTLLTTGPIPKPLAFFAYVSAQQPATYRTTALTVPVSGGTIPLQLRAWTDDSTWAARVGGLFAKALPILRRDIGLAWPHDGPVVVQEAVSRSSGGYAGLFDPAADQIQVAYWASSAVIVHEAAHGWFSGELVADRWAAEGFASLYAQRTLGALSIKASAPSVTAALRKAAFPLNAWPASPSSSTASESYGYAAAYTLASLIAERAGVQALPRVWADAATRTGAYQPPTGQGSGAPETVDGPPDWRGLLDLLESETGTSFTDLWRTWVVRPAEAALLDERAAARADYASLEALADGWALPRSVRDALRAWQFPMATAELAAARRALAARASVEQAAAGAGLTLSDAMQTRFEAGDLAGALAVAQAEQVAITAIAEAGGDRAASSGLVGSVGLIGENPEAALATAQAALASGDAAGAAAAAQTAQAAWRNAPAEGRRRLLMGAALAAALGVLGVSVLGRLLRWRRSRAAPAAS